MSDLENWIDAQYAHAARGLLRGISPTGIVKTRPHFYQTIAPKKGSVVASPVLAAYDPDPDYFFHWYRDSAIVMDALRILYIDGTIGCEALDHVSDFVSFSLALSSMDGRGQALPRAYPTFEKFLRKDLSEVFGDAVAADTRVNPDGTLDISDWGRPQNDGPALRALTLMRWMDQGAFSDKPLSRLATLIQSDLNFVLRCARTPCIDIWEEDFGQHYFTMRVSAAALARGASWLISQGNVASAQLCSTEALGVTRELDKFWRAEGYIGSRVLASGAMSPKDLDISVILAAIHGEGVGGDASNERVQATLEKLDALFGQAYAINRHRSVNQAPALGRYAGDVYYSGGAYYFSTLGAAEFCFRTRQSARGDMYLETVRRFTPDSGAMSEQFDQSTGAQTSAKHLTWSYAAFISCIAARRRARRKAV